MVSLTQDSKGNYRARKRLPDEVREQYGHIFGRNLEEKFYRPAGTRPDVAKREFNEWLAQVETQIANVRAQINGERVSLTRKDTRALAGDWYRWFIDRHPHSDLQTWEGLKEKVHDAFKLAVPEAEWAEHHRYTSAANRLKNASKFNGRKTSPQILPPRPE